MARVEVERLLTQLIIWNASLDYLRWHKRVERFAIGLLIRNLTPQHKRLNNQLCKIHAAHSHVVRIGTRPSINLKELVLAIAHIVFSVKVSKTHVARAFAEAARILNELLMAFKQNGYRVSNARGRVVLQHHTAARNHADIALLVRKRCERANSIVITRNKILNHKLLVVARIAQQIEDAREVGSVVYLVDFFLTRKAHEVIARRV